VATHGPIEQLLQDPRLWQAGRSSSLAQPALATGWPGLDQALGGGWPCGQLTELLIDAHGIGELSLLLPALAAASARDDRQGTPGWITLVSPPHVPYAPALARCGLELSRLLVVHSKRDIDTLWAVEQAVHAGTCAAVVGWSAILDEGALRRLQLAAEASGTWTVLVRPSRLRATRSPAPLRVCLRREGMAHRLVVEILKRRGGPPATVTLDIE
jgi:cell division inhibitor SulA/protein ImuA